MFALSFLKNFAPYTPFSSLVVAWECAVKQQEWHQPPSMSEKDSQWALHET
jgi:hypothetical protein